MLSLARIAAALVWTTLLAIPTLPVLILLLPFRPLRVKVAAWYARGISLGALPLLGIRVHYEGLEHLDGSFPAIYLANHASNVDPFLAMWHCPIGAVGVAKRAVSYIPVFGQIYALSGHLLIDRSNSKSTRGRLDGTAELIAANGMGLYIWPEGTQPRDGRLLPFKKGFVHLAIATGLPVVPIVVKGAHDRWPARTLVVHPGDVHVEVLEPIQVTDWTADRAAEIAEEVRGRFIEHLSEAQRPLT